MILTDSRKNFSPSWTQSAAASLVLHSGVQTLEQELFVSFIKLDLFNHHDIKNSNCVGNYKTS